MMTRPLQENYRPAALNVPIPAYDVSLLFQRMAMLRIDPGDLAEEDPLLFRELQGMCALCQSRGQCAADLAHEFEDPGWQGWRDYCPNATTLSMLSALRVCYPGPGGGIRAG